MEAIPYDSIHGIDMMLRNQRHDSFGSDSDSSSDSSHARRTSVMAFGDGFTSFRRSMHPKKLRQRLAASFSTAPSNVDVSKMYVTMGWEKVRPVRPISLQVTQPKAEPPAENPKEELDTPVTPTSPIEVRVDDTVIREDPVEAAPAQEQERATSRLSFSSALMEQTEASEFWSPLD